LFKTFTLFSTRTRTRTYAGFIFLRAFFLS
jgi:hypothetical protein